MLTIKFKKYDMKTSISTLNLKHMNIEKAETVNTKNKKKVAYAQYTGLRDKNGKEIYEWDILAKEEKHFVVLWFDAYARFALYGNDERPFHSFSPIKDYTRDYRIIGNLFETPELADDNDLYDEGYDVPDIH